MDQSNSYPSDAKAEDVQQPNTPNFKEMVVGHRDDRGRGKRPDMQVNTA